MDNCNYKNDDRTKNFISDQFLGELLDYYESHKIMSEVFFSFLPNEIKTYAMTEAAVRIKQELKDSNE